MTTPRLSDNPDGTRLCTKCGVTKPILQFSGKQSWCRLCIRGQNRVYNARRGKKARRTRNPLLSYLGLKQCFECDGIYPLSWFSPSIRGYDGVAAYCKDCQCKKVKAKISLETRRAKTQSYRDNNRERWRALHRINQFNRRHNTKLRAGKVSTAFMKMLYAVEHCHYCRRYTEQSKRTADHIVPLAKGGEHAEYNLVMACLWCNSKKRDRTVEEFLQELNGTAENNSRVDISQS